MNRLILSTLVLAAALVSLPIGCSAEPGAAIEKLGGKVTRDTSLPEKPVIEVNLEQYRGSAADLAVLGKLPRLRELRLGPGRDVDPVLAHLEGLTNLESLLVGSASDAGLAHLKRLTSLKRLTLISDRVTDDGLAHLKGLKNLRTLNLLSCKKVTDDGLKHLQGLTELQVLDFTGCSRLSDAGLEHLKGLTKLFSLGLMFTNVTATGVESLGKALPGLSNVSWKGSPGGGRPVKPHRR